MNELATRAATSVAPRPSSDLADLARVPIDKPLKTLEEAILYGRAMAMADLLPTSLRDKNTKQIKVADVVLILCMGAEMELSPQQSLRGIYVVSGRPMLSAQLWATRIRKFRHKLTLVEEELHPKTGRPVSATTMIIRGDDKTRNKLKFSIWEARNAGLCQVNDDAEVRARSRFNDSERLPWEMYTATMLRNRSLSHNARFMCPEVVFGNMGIRGEEYDEFQEEDGFGDDEFVTDPAMHGTPEERESITDELAALADRMIGRVPTPISDFVEPFRGDDPAAAREALAELHRRADPPRTAAKEFLVEPGTPVRQHPTERTCDICGTRMFPHEHTGTDFDHAPVWVAEPEDF